MSSLGTVYLDVSPKLARGFTSDIERKVGQDFDAMGDRVGNSLGSKIGGGLARGVKAATAGIAIAGAAGAVVGKQFLELGANLEATAAKAKIVFGPQLGVVEQWAKTSASAMGLTKSQAVGLAAGFGDLLIPMGFTRKAAAGMATDVIGLSGALSEWSGGKRSAAEVSEILQSAMLGEREALKGLGISISEEDVKARLAAKGQDKLTGALRQQAEAVATQELIFEKSKDAQDAYAKGTAKGLRAQAEFKAKIGELKEALARGLYPVLTKVMGFVANNIDPAIAKAKAAFEKFKPTLLEVGRTLKDAFVTAAPKVKAAVAKIVEAVQAVVAWVRAAAPQIKAAVESIRDVIVGIISWVQDFVDKFRSGQGEVGEAANKLGGIFGRLKEIVVNAFNAVRAVVETVVKIVTNLWDRFGKDILQFTKAVWNGVLEVVRGALGFLGGIFDLVGAIFTGKWGEAWDALKGIVAGAWDTIFGIVRFAITGLGDFLLQAGGAVLSAAWSFIWNSLKTLFDDIWDNVIFKGITAAWGVVERFFTETIPEKMKSTAAHMWDWIIDGLAAILNTAIALIEKGINLATAPLRGASSIIDKVTPGHLPDILKDPVSLPRVNSPSGGTKEGDKNVTINVAQTDPDPKRLAREMIWALE